MDSKEINRKSNERELGPLLFILMICLVIPLAVRFHGAYLEKKAEYESSINEEASLNNDIIVETKRLEELKREESYLRTNEGVERIAREKLGLIKPGEIPFVLSSSGKKEDKSQVQSPGKEKLKGGENPL